ncbi:MAG: FG-GAP-like repeat-containing protein, partial [Candidatus Kapaibacteriota bacterium]
MKKIFTILVSIVLFSIYNSIILISQEILWWYDLKDSAFGQACAGDIDNDNFYEIVFGCYRNDSCVYALNSEDGSLLWKYNTSTATSEGCNDVAPLIFDVNKDGANEVIVPSSCNPTTFCFNGSDGSLLWKTPTRGSDSPPTIGDLDGNGELEILHGEFGGYVVCIDAKTGKKNWEILVHPKSWIQTAPTLVDLDGDGLLDFIVATWCLNPNDTNWVYAYRGYDQKLLWKKPIGGRVYHGFSIADLDDDGSSELIFGDYSGTLYVFNSSTGEVLWTYHDNEFYYLGSPVTIADLNNDGKCELVFTTAFSVVSLKSTGELFWKYD